MAKDRESITNNGRAAFYASIWPDLKQAATQHGWALGLHGSLATDMDIMAMPWDENASPVHEVIQAISDCFTESPFKDEHTVASYNKPNGRVVYTMSIWADWYLDINVIQSVIEPTIITWEKGETMETLSVHDETCIVYGIDQYGIKYQGKGEYSCGELVDVTDVENL